MDVKRVFAKLTWTQLLGNLFGALLTWFYFRFVDYTAAQFQAQISRGEIVYFVLGFAALIAVGIAWGSRWARPLERADPTAGADAALVRRRAILVPYVFAALSFGGWILAGLVWGVLYPILWGIFSPARSLRSAVGILAAVGLSLYVASSVAGPLGQLQTAMRDVERGDLETRCPVVTNDEIGAVSEGFNRMVGGLKEREFLKETFGKYVSREIRDEILAGRISLEGQAQEVTVLFADLRDFTPWVEATSPREVVRDLNAYFTEMDRAIREHRGLVLQFIGDEIEAAFGAPVAYPTHAEMAVRAALEMRRRLAAWNDERARAGKVPLRHGIGIHTGSVLAGNIGSSERHSYALVGDPVNLASRIQNLNKEFGSDILVSGDTRRRLDGRFELVALPAVRVKGKSGEVEVYRLA